MIWQALSDLSPICMYMDIHMAWIIISFFQKTLGEYYQVINSIAMKKEIN